MGSAFLATSLDKIMLSGKISSGDTALEDLEVKSGTQVALELGGRMLLRYVVDVKESSKVGPTFVTPTPFSADEVTSYLALPNALARREWVVVIDPSKIDNILGPRWCSMGQGIEYILPDGYSPAAIYGPAWALEVR